MHWLQYHFPVFKAFWNLLFLWLISSSRLSNWGIAQGQSWEQGLKCPMWNVCLCYRVFEEEQPTLVLACAACPLVLLMGAFKPGKELPSWHPPYPAGWLHSSSEGFVTAADSFHRSWKVCESCRVNYFIMPVLYAIAPVPQCTQAVKMRLMVGLVFCNTMDW